MKAKLVMVQQSPVSLALLFSLVAALLVAPGCGSSAGGAPSVEAQMSIERVAKWYQFYRANNRGKAPADEDAFVEFINKTLAERGEPAIGRDELLNSLRDGQKYTIRYGKAPPTSDADVPVVYEQTGDGDGKLYATELGRSREVDDAELQSMLAEGDDG